MKLKSHTYHRWLLAAYNEFALYGPHFSLKALAEKTSLPRATLYYHFSDKNHLIEELLDLHLQIANDFQSDLKKQVSRLIPDLYTIMFQYKGSVQFHQQLLKNNQLEGFAALYQSINNSSIRILLPHIKEHFKTKLPDHEITEFYATLTDAWYARLSFNNISAESMCQLALEIMQYTLGLCVQSEELVALKS
ncbi:TetR/AcrR family transcriptional regulator [Carboxylicivirga taeanensis]|uniref:TetR/AcrR family transcriptional regulator n=1 Tax=Carboxylicivirga taeanensis TaxID=1416875 RepID=UPI003F6E0D87